MMSITGLSYLSHHVTVTWQNTISWGWRTSEVLLMILSSISKNKSSFLVLMCSRSSVATLVCMSRVFFLSINSGRELQEKGDDKRRKHLGSRVCVEAASKQRGSNLIAEVSLAVLSTARRVASSPSDTPCYHAIKPSHKDIKWLQ